MRNIELRRIERRRAPRGRAAIKPGTLDPREIGKLEARLAMERGIALAHLLGEEGVMLDDGLTAEQRRQVARRTLRALSDRAQGNPRFDPDAMSLDSRPERRH